MVLTLISNLSRVEGIQYCSVIYVEKENPNVEAGGNFEKKINQR